MTFPLVVRSLENRLRFLLGLMVGIAVGKVFSWMVIVPLIICLIVIIWIVTHIQHQTHREIQTFTIEELEYAKSQIAEIKKSINDAKSI
jgi:signal transduction histidine kinase